MLSETDVGKLVCVWVEGGREITGILLEVTEALVLRCDGGEKGGTTTWTVPGKQVVAAGIIVPPA
jgi:hypothetical protein